ncbi:unnamed protein product [Cochlearia groenlandica]
MEYNLYNDSQCTMDFLCSWKTPSMPPEEIVPIKLVENCSRGIRKQLLDRDVTKEGGEQSILVLSRSQVANKFLPCLHESEFPRQGLRVSVYGPDGKVYDMKLWVEEMTGDLDIGGWNKLVQDYELKEICDFVTVWLFRHKESLEICLAIECTRFSLTSKVSKRICKAAFEDSY